MRKSGRRTRENKMVKFTLVLPESTYKALENVALEYDISMSYIMRYALERCLQNLQVKKNEGKCTRFVSDLNF